MSAHTHGWSSLFVRIHFCSQAVAFVHGQCHLSLHSFMGSCVCSWAQLHSFVGSWVKGPLLSWFPAKMAGEVFTLPHMFSLALINISFPLSQAKLAGKGLSDGPLRSVQH